NDLTPLEDEKKRLMYNPPPDGGYGWVVVACSFLLEFFAEGPISAFGVFQEYYVNERFKGHASNATISLVGVLSGSCMAILGVVSGKLCEKYGYRIVPLCGIVTLSAALTFLPAAVVPSQWFERRRGLATGAVNMGIGVGGLVWTQFNHLMIRKISVEWTLRLTSIVVLITCTASLFLIKTYQSTTQPRKTSAFVAKYFGVDTLPVFVGLYYTVSGFGYLFGPPIAGVILEKTRSWDPPYIALKIYTGLPMVVACMAIVTIWTLTRKQPSVT
ncbi:hypothetical protein LPJ64_002536, partial [Coemansia asiatica]